MKPTDPDVDGLSVEEQKIADKVINALDASVDALPETTRQTLKAQRARIIANVSPSPVSHSDRQAKQKRGLDWFSTFLSQPIVMGAAVTSFVLVFVFVVVTIESPWVSDQAPMVVEASKPATDEALLWATEVATLNEQEWEAVQALEFAMWLSELEEESLTIEHQSS